MAYTSEHPPFSVTADLVVLTLRDDALQVLLVRRGGEPYAGRWALPGGFVQVDEDLEAAAYRELAEEAGVGRGDVHLEQLATWGAPGRDPRGRVVTVAWLAFGADLPDPTSGSDAADARWVPVDQALSGDEPLAFDHDEILTAGVERARAKLEYSTLATRFCDDEFTIGDLRHVYETVWGVRLDPGNFHRKALREPGFVEPVGRGRATGGRPAELFRAGSARVLSRPIQRSSF